MKNIAFYIASRYLLAKKGSTAVTFITWLSAGAMMVAVTAMFVIISVFSGLETLNKDLISNLHADLTLKSASGKTVKDLDKVIGILKNNKAISNFSRVIEEKVYVNYKGKGDIAYIRGVDSAYIKVNPINEDVFYGTYPSFKYSNEVLMETNLHNRLSIPIDSTSNYATVFMPKPGTGIINKEEDIYNKRDFLVTGVFPGKEQLDSYIIAPIELTEELLSLPKKSAYQIVIKLKNPENADAVKQNLLTSLGKNVEIKTKEEENAAFWKMINTEKMFIYLIFALVIFITTFNLAGAIIILQIDKKEQSRSLISLGFPLSHLRMTYFYTGILIVISGVIAGLIAGTILCYFQLYTEFFRANELLPFPVKIVGKNYVIVALTASLFGIMISWFFSKINKDYITKS
ncbi:ABC transporter permease [Chryseobacterium carnipullorum]|uniref:ABC transporter permease n=1 Tax=Chryseobacterium carnipullorum TaxID=1124835 RepID=A0A1M7E7W8_CHRCU|nr:ABC transporter permease [Chryseobacterium carnipullorum]MDN5397400.1 ABC transporter permease [Chryseobacterium sp.]AZA47111.1 ABC transporter permease [Chryseobacterium carnipullorum]AZA66462.1 ABC transporter permease [Chryseobacterium carnipullorum]MDN5476574.1 ABC transporter permease [Chryseobacterium sp.]MDN5481109.1 ABC transporter permease [Chryseobacterium sp.]